MADRVGQQLGNYRLTHLLGRGGFADVYLGDHIHLDTHAAIKVLHTQLTSEDVEKFRTEARTLARLVHPQIVRLLDFGIEDNTPFLVMDYAPNGSLRQRYPRSTILPLTTVVPYVTQVAEALQFAHDEKLIHRDIKPENIFLGRRNEVVLGDFGIAVLSRTARSQSILAIAGTAAYIAPEQLQGRPSRASDQYSLGIVAYEWLSGDVPFHGAFVEIASQHMLVPPPPLREKVPTLSPAVELVVLKALEKEPQKRFASVREFAQGLEQASKIDISFFYAPTLVNKTKEQWLDEGDTHYDAERYKEAIAAYDHAIALDPNYAKAYNNRGTAYADLKKYQRAIADFDRAIQLDPNFAVAHYDRGFAYSDLKDYQRAIADFDRAIQLDPNHAWAYGRRGLAHYYLENYQRAVEDFDRALELDPSITWVNDEREEAYRILKKPPWMKLLGL